MQRTFGFINAHSLARKKLFTAYRRFILWQLQSSFTQKLIVKNFIGNVRFYAKKGLTGITGNIYTGLHEFEDMSFLLHFLRPEDTFFDIGANVGSYSLLASGFVGANSITFEPSLQTFNILLRNIKLNNLETKISPLQLALGRECGKLAFTTKYDTGNHIVTIDKNGNNNIIVEVKKLDDFIKKSPILLKIDVEGFETEVLNGGKVLLREPTLKGIIIELNGSGSRYGYDENHIHQLLTKNGFLPYIYDPFTRNFTLINKFGTHNTIYIRDFIFVKDRCNKAHLVTSLGISF
ncbi:FkbM family methyltransferase [Pseudopedobacter beijingensis]|uniref:FkbM family methyltransferase n=1 Tax=Pseudopedobacter beijingensis TaxID=1207056 RepID=A0ABW4I774_9SPHI